MILRAFVISSTNVLGRAVQLIAFVLIGRWFGAGPETDIVFLHAAPLYVLLTVAFGIGEVVFIPHFRRSGERAKLAHQTSIVFGAVAVTLAGLLLSCISWYTDALPLLAYFFLVILAFTGTAAAVYSSALHAGSRHSRALIGPLPGGAAALVTLLIVSADSTGLAAALAAFEVGRCGYLLLMVCAGKSNVRSLAVGVGDSSGLIRRRVGWQLLASSAIALNPVVDLLFAKSLQSGSVTALEYASRLWNAVPLLFSGLVILLHVQWVDEQERLGLWVRKVRRTSLLVGITALPVAISLVLLAPSIIHVLYSGGRIDSAGIDQIATSLAGYLPGAVPFVASLVLIRAISARGDIKIIAFVSVLSVPLNVVLDMALIDSWGVAGLAMATSTVYLVNYVVLWLWIGRGLSR